MTKFQNYKKDLDLTFFKIKVLTNLVKVFFISQSKIKGKAWGYE